jgi:hypothetical protein
MMKKIYMKLYDFFSKIASYFLKKSLNQKTKKEYHETNTKTKKTTKRTSTSDSKKSKKG